MKMNTNVNIQGIVLTLTKDLLSDSYKTADIAAFYLDQLVLRILDTEVIFFFSFIYLLFRQKLFFDGLLITETVRLNAVVKYLIISGI